MDKQTFVSIEAAQSHFGEEDCYIEDFKLIIETGGCYGVLVYDEEDDYYYVDWLVS